MAWDVILAVLFPRSKEGLFPYQQTIIRVASGVLERSELLPVPGDAPLFHFQGSDSTSEFTDILISMICELIPFWCIGNVLLFCMMSPQVCYEVILKYLLVSHQ
jgi:hypothetical protein